MVSTLLDVVYIESKIQMKNPESYATKSNKVSAYPKWLSFVGFTVGRFAQIPVKYRFFGNVRIVD